MIRVRVKDRPDLESTFSDRFTIGRGDDCDLKIESHLVSRSHAEVTPLGGRWIVRDLRSSNGTFVDGGRVSEVEVDGSLAVELGKDGPQLRIDVLGSPRPAASDVTTQRIGRQGDHAPRPAASGDDVDEYVSKYFRDSDEPAGDHTRMMRQAYKQVHKKTRRGFYGVIASITVLLVAALAYGGYQQARSARLESQFHELAVEMRKFDADYFALKASLDDEDGAVSEILRRQRENVQSRRKEVEKFITDMGVRRRATPREQAIFRVALVFNENHVDMPAGFVRAVNEEIARWQSPRPRARYVNAIRSAEENGYTPYIVRTMQRNGLPPEFFYLALQESELDPKNYGPRTRCCGVAKGMWQFIQETGAAYGLSIGRRASERAYDPTDERHDFHKSTDAAAQYLSDIYGQLAQSSGLLAMASYNWGEHRVVPRLKELVADIPDEMEARSYWKFYNEYEGRMPEETKTYVLRIFAAAVIGENPRLFGFDFDNPLAKYTDSVE